MNHNRYVRALDHNGQFGQRVSMRNFDRGNFVRPLYDGRLQNSPYFCVFKYARAVKQKVWNEAENRERDWRETLKFFFSRLTRLTGVRLAREARVRLLRHAFSISLLILRKNPTVLQSIDG